MHHMNQGRSTFRSAHQNLRENDVSVWRAASRMHCYLQPVSSQPLFYLFFVFSRTGELSLLPGAYSFGGLGNSALTSSPLPAVRHLAHGIPSSWDLLS